MIPITPATLGNDTALSSVKLTLHIQNEPARIQQASAKLRNVFVKALLWC